MIGVYLDLVTCSSDQPPDLTCFWKQNTHSDPTKERKYICCCVFSKEKPLNFQRLLFFSLYTVCLKMSMTPQALSADRKLSLAVPLEKQHDRKSAKEKKERKKEKMCPHECDILLPD